MPKEQTWRCNLSYGAWVSIYHKWPSIYSSGLFEFLSGILIDILNFKLTTDMRLLALCKRLVQMFIASKLETMLELGLIPTHVEIVSIVTMA